MSRNLVADLSEAQIAEAREVSANLPNVHVHTGSCCLGPTRIGNILLSKGLHLERSTFLLLQFEGK